MDNYKTPVKEITLVFILLVVVLPLGLYLVDKTLNSEMELLRKQNSPTKHEYKVLSVEKGSTFLFNEVYYDVTYIGADNLLITQNFETKDRLHLVVSNESKLIIENPELNGYPLRYTLYWEFD